MRALRSVSAQAPPLARSRIGSALTSTIASSSLASSRLANRVGAETVGGSDEARSRVRSAADLAQAASIGRIGNAEQSAAGARAAQVPRDLEQRLQGAGSEALAVDDHGLAGAQLAADALGRRSMWAVGRRVVAELGRQRGGEGGGVTGRVARRLLGSAVERGRAL